MIADFTLGLNAIVAVIVAIAAALTAFLNALAPALMALATALAAWNAIVLRRVHINTNSTLTEARAARDVALASRDVAVAAQQQAEEALIATRAKQP